MRNKAEIQYMMSTLNRLYKTHRALYERDDNGRDIEWIEKNDKNKTIVAYRRKSAKESIVCLHNFVGLETVEYTILLNKESKNFEEIFNSDSHEFGGNGNVNKAIEIVYDTAGIPQAYKVKVPPLSSIMIKEI